MVTQPLSHGHPNNMNAAADVEDELDKLLVGRTLDRGWEIVSVLDIGRDAPARCRTYVGKAPNGSPVFIKVLDPRGTSSLRDDQRALDEFAYEKELIDKCGQRKMRRVVRGLDDGEILVPGVLPVRVHYLVFEWAALDVRSHYEDDDQKHVVTSLRWLHHMATALHELHFSWIAHQDVKPAHVIVLPEGDAKLAGLSSAHDSTRPRPYGEAGRDRTWAPPEVLYGGTINSFDERCAADLFQLGSLAIFLFTSIGFNAQLQRILHPMHSWHEWRGTYKDALPYVRAAHRQILDSLSTAVPDAIREKFISTVEQLTDPEPALRGHPQNIQGKGTRYGLERFISAFDILSHRARLQRRSRV